MDVPDDMRERAQQWTWLAELADTAAPGAQAALVLGRRRQGKSRLLRRFVAERSGLYHQCIEGEPAAQLDLVGRTLAEASGVRDGRLRLDSWVDAIERLLTPPASHPSDVPWVVALDEVPYALAGSPELASVLQRALDARDGHGAPVLLILCGSALDVVERLLDGDRPLRGRVQRIVRLLPFDPAETGRFWGVSNPALALRLGAVVGGTPGYRTLAGPVAPPVDAEDFGRWLVGAVLHPASALLSEDDVLLAEDARIVDRSLYRSILRSLASGTTQAAHVAAALGRPAAALQRPLGHLVETGYVNRIEDPLRDRRPTYRLADPLIRFLVLVAQPERPRIDAGRGAEAWERRRHTFDAQLLGPFVEDVARWWVERAVLDGRFGAEATTVGPHVLADRSTRSSIELDAVVTAGKKVFGVCEVKATAAKRGVADLDRLERARAAFGPGIDATGARLVLVSVSGFEPALVRATADRNDVDLVDASTLLGGDAAS